MSVSAEMQWTPMPPRAFADTRVTIAGAMEPAYTTAGDAYDYALAGDVARLAVFDAMGHDTWAGLTANLALATCRNQHRSGADLETARNAIEAMLVEQLGGSRYATAILADLDLRTGMLTWINCGHRLPVLIRGGRWTTYLRCRPAHPLGTDLNLPVTVCQEQLQPRDRVLFYTDGTIEARDVTGREFGRERFIEFIIRHQADRLATPETLRRLVHAVLAHHQSAQETRASAASAHVHPCLPVQPALYVAAEPNYGIHTEEVRSRLRSNRRAGQDSHRRPRTSVTLQLPRQTHGADS